MDSPQAERKMIRDRCDAVTAGLAADPGSAVTLHQAAVLEKKMELVKRFSASEAMQIHAAAAVEAMRASAEYPASGSSIMKVISDWTEHA